MASSGTTFEIPAVRSNEETGVNTLQPTTPSSPVHHLRSETTNSLQPCILPVPDFPHPGSPTQRSAHEHNITVPEIVNLVLASIGVISTVTISIVFGVYTVRFGDDTNNANAATTQSTFDATTFAELTLLQTWYGNSLALLAFCQAYPNVNNASCPRNATVAAQQLAAVAADIVPNPLNIRGTLPPASSTISRLSMGVIIVISYICVTVVVVFFVFLLRRRFRYGNRAPRVDEKERRIS